MVFINKALSSNSIDSFSRFVTRLCARSWVSFVPLVLHERKRDAIIEKILLEKLKKFTGLVLKGWKKWLARRRSARRNYQLVKKFTDIERKKTCLSSWVLVYMRVRRAKNTVTAIEDARTKDKLAELETTNEELLERQDETEKSRKEIESQLAEIRKMKAKFCSQASEARELTEIKSKDLENIKRDVSNLSRNLVFMNDEAKKLEKIENQRKREVNKVARAANLQQLKSKRDVAASETERDILLCAISRAKEHLKTAQSDFEEQTNVGIALILEYEQSMLAANREVLILHETGAKEMAEQSDIREKLEDIRKLKDRVTGEEIEQRCVRACMKCVSQTFLPKILTIE